MLVSQGSKFNALALILFYIVGRSLHVVAVMVVAWSLPDLGWGRKFYTRLPVPTYARCETQQNYQVENQIKQSHTETSPLISYNNTTHFARGFAVQLVLHAGVSSLARPRVLPLRRSAIRCTRQHCPLMERSVCAVDWSQLEAWLDEQARLHFPRNNYQQRQYNTD
jgi:hypothetical protein